MWALGVDGEEGVGGEFAEWALYSRFSLRFYLRLELFVAFVVHWVVAWLDAQAIDTLTQLKQFLMIPVRELNQKNQILLILTLTNNTIHPLLILFLLIQLLILYFNFLILLKLQNLCVITLLNSITLGLHPLFQLLLLFLLWRVYFMNLARIVQILFTLQLGLGKLKLHHFGVE